jgi:hypothetical protein
LPIKETVFLIEPVRAHELVRASLFDTENWVEPLNTPKIQALTLTKILLIQNFRLSSVEPFPQAHKHFSQVHCFASSKDAKTLSHRYCQCPRQKAYLYFTKSGVYY